MTARLKILFVSPEVQPFAKTGGLGDISSALPLALKNMDHDIRVIMPKYKNIKLEKDELQLIPDTSLSIPIGQEIINGDVCESKLDNQLPIYFINCDKYFARKNLYSENGQEYPDNPERFIFFSRAVLEACKKLNFQPDIIHCNDWQTGLICAYLESIYKHDDVFKNTASVFSIHNLGFQGNYSPDTLSTAHLPHELYSMHGLEFYGALSFLKAGLVYANALTTVSKTYCREILNPKNGFKMEGVLRSRKKDLYGILNGANYEEWNPKNDNRIAMKFSSKDMQGKLVCKNELLKNTGLKIDREKLVVCMVTRLSSQKGMDMVMKGLDEILEFGAALIILGSGDSIYEEFFTSQSASYPEKLYCHIGFDEDLAHQIIAGSDILLMPSEYEPCGLTQMHAMKYGTVPLVRSIGGLRDTVKTFDPESLKGTGFKFLPLEVKYLLNSFRKAESIFKRPDLWNKLVGNCMAENFDWSKSALEYTRIYHKALNNRLN
ncbi:MAG: glycogen synthase GlgA [Nitrospinales bacterium]